MYIDCLGLEVAKFESRGEKRAGEEWNCIERRNSH